MGQKAGENPTLRGAPYAATRRSPFLLWINSLKKRAMTRGMTPHRL